MPSLEAGDYIVLYPVFQHAAEDSVERSARSELIHHATALLSIGFDPPQVQDGGDTTLISPPPTTFPGSRGISGTLTSPNGKAVQGFAHQRDGETTRYFSRIHIPRKGRGWHLESELSDDERHGHEFGHAQLRAGNPSPLGDPEVISSASDETPPTLRNVWLDRRTMRIGEHNTLFVRCAG